jgi:hypothetical protein
VQFRNGLHNRQPEAGVFSQAARGIDPVETVKNQRQMFRRDSLARIFDTQPDKLRAPTESRQKNDNFVMFPQALSDL